MRQVWIPRTGGPKVLEVRETEDPAPGPGEVLLEVAAAGVNFADVLARRGIYPDAPPLPAVVGYEVAGRVGAIGEGVDRWSVGDPVLAMTRFGGYSERVCVPADQVVSCPPALSFSEGAAVPVNGLTAALALFHFGNLRAGERVLVHNAGGGVGLAAVQMAKARGAEVFGTASSWKHERLRELGLDRAIDYRREDFVEVLGGLGKEGRMDLILDPVGGRSLRKGLKVLAPLGRLVAFGVSEAARAGRWPKLSLVRTALRMPRPGFLSLLDRNLAVSGLNVGHLWEERDRIQPWIEEVLALVETGHYQPLVSAEVPFAEAAEAHRWLEERRNFGKVVLVP